MTRFLSALSLLVFTAAPAAAQVGIGGQVGEPTGLSLKFGAGQGALAVAVGWDLDDSISAEAHYILRERRLQGSSGARLFYGPGAFIDVQGSGRNEDVDAGVSLGVGLSAMLAREIELYGLISPRLRLVDETGFEIGGGVGLRLYL